jgi:hypothetical protein
VCPHVILVCYHNATCYRRVSTAGAVPILLSHLEPRLNDDSLPRLTLTLTCKMLGAIYPPKAEQLRPALEILRLLCGIIHFLVSDDIIRVLEIVQSGLCVWIEDESEVLLDSEYNNVVSYNIYLQMQSPAQIS